jgi:hypothetical protein
VTNEWRHAWAALSNDRELPVADDWRRLLRWRVCSRGERRV